MSIRDQPSLNTDWGRRPLQQIPPPKVSMQGSSVRNWRAGYSAFSWRFLSTPPISRREATRNLCLSDVQRNHSNDIMNKVLVFFPDTLHLMAAVHLALKWVNGLKTGQSVRVRPSREKGGPQSLQGGGSEQATYEHIFSKMRPFLGEVKLFKGSFLQW